MNSTKKGDISLSMNFLVIIIISFVLLGMGITLLYNLLGKANSEKAQLDARTEQEISRLLIDEGKTVALPLNTIDLYPGESHVFGLGILNIDTNDQYKVEITFTTGINAQKGDITITNENLPQWLLYSTTPFTVQQSQHLTIPLRVEVPDNAEKGQYIFNVKVMTATTLPIQYGHTQKFIINVR